MAGVRKSESREPRVVLEVEIHWFELGEYRRVRSDGRFRKGRCVLQHFDEASCSYFLDYALGFLLCTFVPRSSEQTIVVGPLEIIHILEMMRCPVRQYEDVQVEIGRVYGVAFNVVGDRNVTVERKREVVCRVAGWLKCVGVERGVDAEPSVEEAIVAAIKYPALPLGRGVDNYGVTTWLARQARVFPATYMTARPSRGWKGLLVQGRSPEGWHHRVSMGSSLRRFRRRWV